MIPTSDEALYTLSPSNNNTTTSYSSMTHPPRGGGGGGGGGGGSVSRSLFKSRSQANTKNKTLELTHAKISDSSLNSPVGTPTGLTPDKRSKSKVGNFVEGVARSFKSKRKPRPTSIYPENAGQIASLRGGNNSTVSPHAGPSPQHLSERRFTMPTVLHIHYSNAKNAQLYKSVLVSENSTTQEVIKQALDRYGMKFVNPSEYVLMEVTGRWETMASGSLESGLEQGLGALVTPLSPGNHTEGKSLSMPSFEEFVICHTRALSENERPYNVQFFHQPPRGYTRRFELRAKYEEDFDGGGGGGGDEQLLNKNLSGSVPTTPLFGTTSHHTCKTKKDDRLHNQETLSYSPASTIKMQEKKDDENVYSASLPSLSFLDCSSPDYVLESQAAPQTEPQPKTPYLINLRLSFNENEYFLYSLTHDKLVLTTSSHTMTTLQDYHQIKLEVPQGSGGPILCCLEYNAGEGTYYIDPYGVSVAVNGLKVIEHTSLLHGDLLQIGDSHLFMYHNNPSPNGGNGWPFSWYPSPIKTIGDSTPSFTNIGDVRNTETSLEPMLPQIVMTTANETIESQPPPSDSNTGGEQRQEERYDFTNRKPLPTLKELKEIEHSDEEDEPMTGPAYQRSRSYSEGQVEKLSVPPQAYSGRHGNKSSSSSFFMRQQKGNASPRSRIPSSYSLLFSYLSSNEDALLDIVITELQPASVSNFPLAPAYTLALCLEQCLREDEGNKKASSFMSKAVLSLQAVVCVS